MSLIIESYLKELEAKTRRVVGKKKASVIVAEIRGHIEESVEALVAGGANPETAEKESLAKLGGLDPRQLVPTDGAPTWLNRLVRSRIAFWYVAGASTLVFWLMTALSPPTVSAVFGVLFGTTAVVFALVGRFGGRFVIMPILMALIAVPIVNALLASLICINVGAGYPFPRLPSVVEADRRTSNENWVAAGRPTAADVDAVGRLGHLYRLDPMSDSVMPSIARGPKGQYRYPDPSAKNWSSESSDLQFVTEQWKKHGWSLQSNLRTAADFHDYDTRYLAPALNQKRPTSPVPGFQSSGGIALMLSAWALTFAMIGDLVRTTVLAIGRLVRGKVVAT